MQVGINGFAAAGGSFGLASSMLLSRREHAKYEGAHFGSGGNNMPARHRTTRLKFHDFRKTITEMRRSAWKASSARSQGSCTKNACHAIFAGSKNHTMDTRAATTRDTLMSRNGDGVHQELQMRTNLS